MTSVRELSGILTDLGKWQTTWDVLGAEDCAIEHLKVFHNTEDQLKATCSCLVGNKSVKALEVGAAEGEGCNALAKLLSLNHCIQSLTIINLGDSDQHTAALADALQSNSSIQQLTLQKLQPSQVAVVCQALYAAGCCGQLQQLQLPGARLDAAAAAALQAAVAANQQLRHLNLKSAVFLRDKSDSSAATQGATAQLFTPAMAKHPCLSKLELQQATGIDAGALGSYFAAVAAAGNKALQAVWLDAVGFGDAGMQQLAAAAVEDLPQSPQQTDSSSSGGVGLTELSLTDNSIGHLGAKALGNMLAGQGFGQLLVLNLNQNAMSGEGLAALAEGLVAAGNCCLQELHLEGNSIKGVEGIVTLLNSSAGRSLTTLNLSHNCIADEAACQLATAVAAAAGNSSLSLQHIDLSSNWIKDQGAEALANMLKAHKTLALLGLQKNRIGCKAIDTLILAAFGSPGLRHMSLDGNRVRDNRTKLDIEGLGRALASRRMGGTSSRRTSAAGSAAPGGADCSCAAAAVGAGSAASVCTSRMDQLGISSSFPSSPMSKQGFIERVAGCPGETADASAAVAAAGRAAKIARLENGSSTSPTAAASFGSASPFFPQAQSGSGWNSLPPGLARSAAAEQSSPDSQAARPAVTSAVGDSSDTHAEAVCDGSACEQGFSQSGFATHVAGPGGVLPGQFGAFPRVGTLGGVLESLSGPMPGSGCVPGPQVLSLPNGFARRLRKLGSRSYSFEFWAKNCNSTDGSGSTALALWSAGQAQPGLEALGAGAGQQQGLAVSALEAASLRLAALTEPDPLPSLDWQLGMAAGGHQNVMDSLSGWMLDDVVDGHGMLSGLRNNSMSGGGGASNGSATLDWPRTVSVDDSDVNGGADGVGVPGSNSSSRPGSPKAAGVVRRLGSGRLLVRKASLSQGRSRPAAAAAAAAQSGLSRFGRSVATAPELP